MPTSTATGHSTSDGRPSGSHSSRGTGSHPSSRSAAARAATSGRSPGILDPAQVWGVDVNQHALANARSAAPGINVVASVARQLPFRDGFVDLAFTVGVLIHQPDSTLPIVISEVVRCARSFVLWAEYHAPGTEEVPYHGEAHSLFRRDYGAIYHELYPELVVRDEGFLDADAGFDRVTWQLLEKPRGRTG